jgi:hypothetical protein
MSLLEVLTLVWFFGGPLRAAWIAQRLNDRNDKHDLDKFCML